MKHTTHMASKTQDMSTGNPLSLILFFSLPLLIGNIFQQVYSMVDTMVVGHTLGDQGIAAIGATTTLYQLSVNFAWALNNGYAIIVTQRFGAHDWKSMRQSIAGMMILDAIVTILLTVLALIFLRPLLAFMNTPESIFADAYRYIAIIYAGMLATVGYNMLSGILRAMGNSRVPLYFLMISSVLNIALDILFVCFTPLGVAGAAIATVIAQAISALLCLLYMIRRYKEYLPAGDDFRVPPPLLRQLLITGFSMAMMVSVIDAGSVIYQRANNVFGEVFITAHAAGRRIVSVFMQPLGSIATACSTFVGQNWGAGKKDRIRRAIHQVCLLEIALSCATFCLLYVSGSFIVQLITGTDDPLIIKNAILSLRIHTALFPALGLVFCLRTSMQSMGENRIPIFASCIEFSMKILAAAWMIPTFGFLGTCCTEPVTWAIMAVFLVVSYIRKKKTLLPEQASF